VPQTAQACAPRNVAPMRLGGEYAQGQISAPRPPVTLQQATNELNDVVVRGNVEIHSLRKLHDFLQAQMRGPVPCNPEKDCEPQHIPMGEIPVALISQSAERSKLMDEIANMLGAV